MGYMKVPYMRRFRSRVPGVPCLAVGGLAALLAVAAVWWLVGRSVMRPFGDRDAATILIVGADQPRHGRSRSDTIMLARIVVSPKPKVSLVSIPRDLYLAMPSAGRGRINGAFSRGGVPLLRSTVETTLDVPVDHWVVLRSEGLAAIVDAIGGLPLTVPKPMDYDDHSGGLHIHLKPGLQRLSGQDVVGYVRFRSDAQGDIGRINRQQDVLRALARQILSPRNAFRLPAVLEAAENAVETDLSSTQLAALAFCLRGVNMQALHTWTLPTRAVERRPYLLLDRVPAFTVLRRADFLD